MKSKLCKIIVASATALCAIVPAMASEPSGLDARNFGRYWRVESESPAYQVKFYGDTAELTAPKGLTLWRNEPMSGNTVIEYDACIMTGRDGDRLSDMNCFWMASDPDAKSIRSREKWRSGVFNNCYSLKLYYLGYGGNGNTTTRFRRYDGDSRGVEQPEFRPRIITEYTDAQHLLKPGKWYHIKIENRNGRVQYFVDGERIVDFLDPNPLTSGHFGFRTTASRARITNFSYSCTPAQSATVGVRPIGGQSSMRASGASFGVPFDRGFYSNKTNTVSVHTADGAVEADAWPMAWWPDGSVKWLGVATSVPAGVDSLTVQVKQSPKKQPKRAMLAQQSANGIVVETGKSTTYIPLDGSAIVDSIVRNGVRVAQNGRLVCATTNQSFDTKVTGSVIERNGVNHAVVKIDGCMAADNGRTWLPFRVRLYFYRDIPEVRMVHSFVYDGNQNEDFIKQLGISFDVPMRTEAYNRHVAFACPDGGVWSEPVQPLVGRRVLVHPADTASMQARQMRGGRVPAYDTFDAKGRNLIDNWAAWDGFRLSQVGPDGFTIRKRATQRSPWIGTAGGTRAPGYVFAGDVTGGIGLMLNDFWQSYPSTLEVSGARTDAATLTAWLWSPEAEPMDLRHYDEVAHDLNASYEDVQPGLSTPYGIARTSELTIYPSEGYRGKEDFDRDARHFASPRQYTVTPEYLHSRRAFGIWSLPDSSTPGRAAIETRLNSYIDLYKDAIEANRWYGFWNYGDVMHAYDDVRHSWKYDVGGYAWDNTELGSNLWLWYMFLRSGRPDIWRMARAMGRHVAEVDVYHIGDNAGLGSRHNVSHWGCGAKEARISQAAFNRFMYYLTADDRSGDLMTAVRNNDSILYTLDPMRLAEPRSKYPCTAPARLRIGPDWLAYAGNWLTEWERTGNTAYRDKIVTGMKSICALPGRLFAGPLALGYNPATGVITSECDTTLRSTNHLMTIMGGFEVMNELMPLIPDAEWQAAWLDLATNYKAMARKISKNRFRVSRLAAYSAWQLGDKKAAATAWHDLLTTNEHNDAPPFRVHTVATPLVPQTLLEGYPISTNETAMWSLDAIYMQEVIPVSD